MTQTEVIKAFEALPVRARLAVARKLRTKVLDDLFEELDAEMPDVEMTTEEIQQEIKAYRNEQKQDAPHRS